MANIKLRENLKQKFLEILSSEKSGGSVSVAALLIGVSRQSIYDWRAQDHNFDELVIQATQEGKSQIADLAEQGLIKRIKDGDTTAIIFTLKTLRSSHYGDKDERNQTEKESAYDSGEASVMKTPQDVILKLDMVAWYYQNIANKAHVMTPEIKDLFENIKATIEKHKQMIK